MMSDVSGQPVDEASSPGEGESPAAERTWGSALLLGALIGLWIGSILAASIPIRLYLPNGGLGYDAHAYWLAVRAENPYGAEPGQPDAYLYSPFFLQIISPIARLSWPAFLTIWMGIEIACLLWLTRPLPLKWRIPVLLLCMPEILFGNIYGLLGVMIVLGFRRPGLWAFAFLTKITIGLVAVVWFAARGEWRSLAWVVGCTAVLAGISALAQPDLWVQWVEFLFNSSDSGSQISRVIRLSLALGIVYWGARRDQRWVVPIGVLLAVPHFEFKNKDFAVLTAAPRLVDRPRSRGQEASHEGAQETAEGSS